MKYKKIILTVIGLGLVFLFFNVFSTYQQSESKLSFQLQLNSDQTDDYQLFYITQEGQEWKEEQSIHQAYEQSGIWQSIEYNLPKNVYSLRLDLGNQKASVSIKDAQLIGNSKVGIDISEIITEENDVKTISQGDQHLNLLAGAEDPYIVLNINPQINDAIEGTSVSNIIISSFISIITAIASLFIIKSAKDVYRFLREIFRGRKLILSLAKNDFKTKYASSYLGIIWGFIQPLLTIVTYWFVFQIGLRSGNVADVPFILWFIVAIIPWFFFSDALSGATNVYSEYSYLVKKVVFKIELLPVVKITSVLFVHLFFIVFIFVMYAGYGYFPSIYNFQLIYYLLCTIALTISVSLLTSAVVLFFKDLNQIIIIVLQMGFWFTPIGWPYTMLSDFWINIFKLNPMFYIVEGYRDTFIRQILFIDHPYYTFYFWMFCTTTFVIGIKFFKKLKPHFADVI